jgi:mono/diheme cytochrome c family protein
MKHAITFLAIVVLSAANLFAHSNLARAIRVDGAQALYDSKCAACHAKDGSGMTAAGKGLKVRDLRSEDVQKQSDDKLFDTIAKGKDKMPAYESLGHDKIHQLVAYIRGLAKK